MKKSIPIMVCILAVMLVIGIGFAATDTDTSTIDATVSGSTVVDIAPNNISFGTLALGANASAVAFEYENVGSSNITSIDAVTSGVNLSGDPYLTGVAANYDASNFIMLSTAGSDSNMSYIAMTEFTNAGGSALPSYVENVTGQNDSGRFHLVMGDLFWATIDAASTTAPNCTNGTLYYFNESARIHNSSQDGFNNGNMSFADDAKTETLVNNGLGFGAGEISILGISYCVYVSADCDKVVLSKYATGIDGKQPYDTGTACTVESDITTDAKIHPGEHGTFWMRVVTPLQGVATGALLQGTITIAANAP